MNNNDYYLSYNEYDNKDLKNLEIELKEKKLISFFSHLIENSEWSYIDNLLSKKIDFYKEINAKICLEKYLENLSNSLYHNGQWRKELINVLELSSTKYFFIKRQFTKNIVKNIKEIENNIKLTTRERVLSSPFSKDTLEIGKKLMTENTNLLYLFKGIKLEEFKILGNKLNLENKLQNKLSKEKKKEKVKKI